MGRAKNAPKAYTILGHRSSKKRTMRCVDVHLAGMGTTAWTSRRGELRVNMGELEVLGAEFRARDTDRCNKQRHNNSPHGGWLRRPSRREQRSRPIQSRGMTLVVARVSNRWYRYPNVGRRPIPQERSDSRVCCNAALFRFGWSTSRGCGAPQPTGWKPVLRCRALSAVVSRTLPAQNLRGPYGLLPHCRYNNWTTARPEPSRSLPITAFS